MLFQYPPSDKLVPIACQMLETVCGMIIGKVKTLTSIAGHVRQRSMSCKLLEKKR